MASTAAVSYCREAGMTCIGPSSICASLVPKCLKDPYRSEAADRGKVHFPVSKWADRKPQKPGKYPSCARLIMMTEVPISKQSLPAPIKKEESDIKKMEVDSPTTGISVYVLRSSQEVVPLEEEDLLMDVDEILLKHLPKDYKYIPSILGKNQSYYEKILLETGSAKIYHTYKKKASKRFNIFSQLKIQRIITLSEWNKEGNPNILKSFIENGKAQYYNYWDYQVAWEKVLYVYNMQMSHSWCVRWEFQTNLPNWFIYKFWQKFGAVREILPDKLREHIPLSEDLIQENINVLRCFCSCGIPWIIQWKWEKVTDEFPYFLKRKIFIRWWNKYDPDPILSGKTIPSRVSSHDYDQETKNKFNQLKLELTTKYRIQNPNMTNEQLQLMVFQEISKIMDTNETEECEKSQLEENYDAESSVTKK